MKKILQKNFAIILFLGIASGLPIVLITTTLKALLVDKGFDLKTIGFFSLVTMPYTFKFFFAPIIDSFGIPILTKLFGQRRSWIILTQTFLVIFISTLGIAGVIGSLSAIGTFSLLLGFASASQDLVIDAYRIELINREELIKKEDQGLVASFYVYGYRIGMLISGAGALILAEIMSWDAVYFIMAGFMASFLVTTLIADDIEKNWKQKKYSFLSWLGESVINPFKDFAKHSKWMMILSFIIFFKLSDVFAGNLTLPFLLEIGFSKIEYASIVKTFGLFATLFGVFAGGFLVKKFGLIKSLWIAALAQMLSNLAFSYLSTIGHNSETLYFVIFIENFSGGIGDSVFVAYLSSLCSIAFSATQYALLSSSTTLARSLFSSSAGIFATALGWYNFFIFSTLLAIPGLIFLLLLTKNKKQLS